MALRLSASAVFSTTAWLIQQYNRVNHATMIAIVLTRPEKRLRWAGILEPVPIVRHAITPRLSLADSSIIPALTLWAKGATPVMVIRR